MKMIEFAKMHGLGNDFVVIDGLSQEVDLANIDISKLAHRQLGIGCDQVLLIQQSNNADFLCVIYNADGSRAEQCGNGMRAVARFVHENKLIHKNVLSIETAAGIVSAIIHDYDNIEVAMGIPQFEPAQIPFQAKEFQPFYDLVVDEDVSVRLTALSMGNPHAIIKIDSIQNFPVKEIGAKISTHSAFSKGTNVGFMEIVNPEHVRLRTFERGVGETFACGSNACAAVIAGIKNYALARTVKVELALGNLLVRWDAASNLVYLSGPATFVFLGRFNLMTFVANRSSAL